MSILPILGILIFRQIILPRLAENFGSRILAMREEVSFSHISSHLAMALQVLLPVVLGIGKQIEAQNSQTMALLA